MEVQQKKFKCDWEGCSQYFARLRAIKVHLRIHTGEKPYICVYEGCGNSFANSSTLKTHVRRHTGEKPYKCDYEACDKSFLRLCDLKVHKRKHTGEKPYTCDYDQCDQSFKCPQGLYYHKQKHKSEKLIFCKVSGCNAKFLVKDQLKKHNKVHLRNTFQSLLCKYPGCENYRCNIHIKNLHPEYSNYYSMIQRTENPNNTCYHLYGARNIKLCKRWRENFWNFVVDMGPRPPGYQLDRENPDGPYSPENCRWASSSENNLNRRASKKNQHKYKLINIELLPAKLWEKVQSYLNKNKKPEKQLPHIPGQLSIMAIKDKK